LSISPDGEHVSFINEREKVAFIKVTFAPQKKLIAILFYWLLAVLNAVLFIHAVRYKFAISLMKFSGREPTKFVKITTETLSLDKCIKHFYYHREKQLQGLTLEEE
jgi:hypothetical protein